MTLGVGGGGRIAFEYIFSLPPLSFIASLIIIFFCDFWQIVELRIIIGVAKSSYNKVDTDQWWLGVLILRKACGHYTHAFTDNNFPSLMMSSMYSMRKTLKARQSS